MTGDPDARPASPRIRPQLRRPIAALAVAQTLVWAGLYYSFPALLVPFEADLGWSKVTLTAAFTLAVIASALAAPVAGRLIDRGYGPQVLLGGAIGGGTLIAGLPVAAIDPILFIGTWTGIGVFMAGCLYEPCFAYLTRICGAAARAAITRITLVAGFAGTVSFPVGSALANWVGWQGAIIGYALLVLLGAVPLFAYAVPRLEAATATPGMEVDAARSPAAASDPTTPVLAPVAPVAAALAQPTFWLLGTAFALMALNHGMILGHLLPLLADRGMPLAAAVLAASLIGPMQVAGRLAMLAIEARVAATGLMVACLVGLTLASPLLALSALVPALVYVAVGVQGASWGVTSITKPVVIATLLGRAQYGTIAGILAVPYLLAFAAAPTLGSLLWMWAGYGLMINVAALSALGAFFALAAARATQRPPATTQPPGVPVR